MRAFSPPFRFLLLVTGGWVCARATYLLWPVAQADDALVRVAVAAVAPRETPVAVRLDRAAPRPRHASAGWHLVSYSAPSPQKKGDPSLRWGDEEKKVADISTPSAVPNPIGTAKLTVSPTQPSRWSGFAYLFQRGGRGQGLAAGGQLGGSQIGARIAYRLGDSPIALAARVSAPLEGRGAEVAAGIDVLPLRTSALRISVERRVAIDAGGRDAWSAYAAGGFYRELRPGLALDGYGQAGVVGIRSRDLFADGALRLTSATGPMRIGGGVWGAAQPGVARLDIGPRIAVGLPVAGASVTAAAEWRVRVAGDARPGSGAAFTLAMDF